MPLETDIIKILKEKSQRPSEIREKLQGEQYKSYDSRSLDVEISRKLTKLEKDGIVQRDDKGHQKVYYTLMEDAKHKVEKVLFEDEIGEAVSEGKLVKATVSKSNIQQYIYEMQLGRITRYLKSSLFAQLKTRTDEAKFFLRNMARQFATDEEEFDITMIHSKANSIIKLTEEEILKLLGEEEERELIHAMFNLRGRLSWSHRDRKNIPITDSRLGELWVILHCNPRLKRSKSEILSLSWSFEKKCFVTWLQQFKGVVYNSQLLDYACPWGKRSETNLSIKDFDEVQRLQTFYHEFSQKKHEYEMIYLKAFLK